MEQYYSSYLFTPYSWTLILTTLISLALALVLWRRRAAAGTRYLAFLELAVAEWAFAVAFESAATDIPLKLLWGQIGYLGTTTSPLFFFLFAMAYGQQGQHLTRRNVALLAVMPVLTIAAAATNDWHHWLWPSLTLDPGTNIAVYGHGPWFWMLVVYSYGLIFIGVLALYIAILRFPSFYRPQIVTLLVGSALPIVGNVMYVLGINPVPGLDWTPLAFALTGLILTWGTLRVQLFDLIPVARSKLMDTMSDGILVVDARGRIVDCNPAMQDFVQVSVDRLIGQPAVQALAHWPVLIDYLQSGTETHAEVRLAGRCYDLRLAQLRDEQGRLTGRLVTLHDITERTRLEEDRVRLIAELQGALAQVKTLRGLLPICAKCKKIRDDQGYWHRLESYVEDHSDAEFTHGICPDCMRELYPGLDHGHHTD